MILRMLYVDQGGPRECLNLSPKDLPNTITIDATQVYHANWDANNDVPSRTIEDSINNNRAGLQ